MFKIGDRVRPKEHAWRAYEKAVIIDINSIGIPIYQLRFDGNEKDPFEWYYSGSLVSLNGIELMLETFEE